MRERIVVWEIQICQSNDGIHIRLGNFVGCIRPSIYKIRLVKNVLSFVWHDNYNRALKCFIKFRELCVFVKLVIAIYFYEKWIMNECVYFSWRTSTLTLIHFCVSLINILATKTDGMVYTEVELMLSVYTHFFLHWDATGHMSSWEI